MYNNHESLDWTIEAIGYPQAILWELEVWPAG